MKKVYYVGYYDIFRQGRKIRSYSLAAARKMDYICTVLEQLGRTVDIVSPAHINIPDAGYIKSGWDDLDNGRRLHLPPSWGAKNKLSRICRVLVSKWWLFAWLLKHCDRNSDVVVYHNYEAALPVLLAQMFRKFNLILEIEEQYSMVWKLTPYQKWKENLLLKHSGGNCLVVSELLAEKMGIGDPIVSYGNYSTYRGEIPDKSDTKKIRLIYTGSIDKVKNSAYMALELMTCLPEQYELKLSGHIAAGEEEEFRQTLDHVNQKCGRAACEYLGVLDDSSYRDLLLSAHIALNLQQEGDFGEFLFPSKILTYLSYSLPVVTTRGGSIVKSSVADVLYFAEDFTCQGIADTVMAVNPGNRTDRRGRLDQLNREFTAKLRARLR